MMYRTTGGICILISFVAEQVLNRTVRYMFYTGVVVSFVVLLFSFSLYPVTVVLCT